MRNLLFTVGFGLIMAQSAQAGVLELDLLPPDFPPSNVCNALPEVEEEELRVAGENPVLTLKAERAFLLQDIRNLKAENAVDWFEFIDALISRLAEVDENFEGVNEAFERIDLYLAAERESALRERQLIEALTLRLDEMSNSQKVRLARYYLNGIGVERNQSYGSGLLVLAAYAGNSAALMELTRLQLRGIAPEAWDTPVELTATLAFGGLIGQANKGICARAERVAREYENGAILKPNPDLAIAWRKFAADLGGEASAWRLVEYHLSAPDSERDDDALLRYLGVATGRQGVDGIDLGALTSSGARTAEDVMQFLGHNAQSVGDSFRQSAVRHLQLKNTPTIIEAPSASQQLLYLREIATLPSAPGEIHFRLAREAEQSVGRWQGEQEIRAALEKAVLDDVPEAMEMLAVYLTSTTNDAKAFERAEKLLLHAVATLQHPRAMERLDQHYRCRVPNAPSIHEADHWGAAFEAASINPPAISAGDLAKQSLDKNPELLAAIQSHALRSNAGAIGDQLQVLQSRLTTKQSALKYWAQVVSLNDAALENFVLQEFDLARTHAQSAAAVELVRRAYFDIGPAIALETALTLIKADGRSAKVVGEIETLLMGAAQRGEGASIRLLARLRDDHRGVFDTYADVIEARGDFLALMFAIDFIEDSKVERYLARARALMRCTTKDVLEMAEAATARERWDDVGHWMRVARSIRFGNPLSKLGLSDRQMVSFDMGDAPVDPGAVSIDALARNYGNARAEYLRASNRNKLDYSHDSAAKALIGIFEIEDDGAVNYALDALDAAPQQVRELVQSEVDVAAILNSLAEAGDGKSAFRLGRNFRSNARSIDDLKRSTDWFEVSAEAGHIAGMVAFAEAIGHGVGRVADPDLAIIWLERAAGVGSSKAKDLLPMFVMLAEQ